MCDCGHGTLHIWKSEDNAWCWSLTSSWETGALCCPTEQARLAGSQASWDFPVMIFHTCPGRGSAITDIHANAGPQHVPKKPLYSQHHLPSHSAIVSFNRHFYFLTCGWMSSHGERMIFPPWPHHHGAPSWRLVAVSSGGVPASGSNNGDTVADREKETRSCWHHWDTWITSTLKLTPPLDFPVSGAKTLRSLFRLVEWGFLLPGTVNIISWGATSTHLWHFIQWRAWPSECTTHQYIK